MMMSTLEFMCVFFFGENTPKTLALISYILFCCLVVRFIDLSTKVDKDAERILYEADQSLKETIDSMIERNQLQSKTIAYMLDITKALIKKGGVKK